MFGTYRLILAVGVVLSHMGVGLFSIHPGIAAVVCFFMVSGYAMSGLLRAAYPRFPQDVPAFYLDRVLRLAPQYYFYLAICAVTVMALGWRETNAQIGGPDAVNVLANLTVLPLQYWMFNDSIGHFILNMPTWSLALEMMFYIVLPGLLAVRRGVWIAAVVAMATWLLSVHDVIHPDIYAYRILPGTLVFFLVGVAVERRNWTLYWTLAAFFAATAASLVAVGRLHAMFNTHLLAGAALGLVTVPLLARLPRRRFDDLLGAVSYGCFLAHWIFITALKAHYGQPWAVMTAVGGSVLCGWLTYTFVEKPTLAYRRRLKARRMAETATPQPAPVPGQPAASTH